MVTGLDNERQTTIALGEAARNAAATHVMFKPDS
jgi:hypothetical protein